MLQNLRIALRATKKQMCDIGLQIDVSYVSSESYQTHSYTKQETSILTK